MLSQLFKIGKIDHANYRFYLAINYSFFLGIILHLAFIPFFYYINVHVLMYYNAISVLIYLSAYILNRKGQHTLSTIFAASEIILHASLATYFIGWETGFYYYLLAIIPALFYNPAVTNIQKFILAVFVAIFYLGLKHFSDTHFPLMPLDIELTRLIYFINSFFLIFIIAALTYYFSLAAEIAENRINQARNQADIANQTKSLFIANMSHELRTPLNAIIGYSEMLIEEEEEQGNDTKVKDLGKISNAGNHLLALINNILDLSKIESGKVELEYQKIDVLHLVDEVISTINPLAEKEHDVFNVSVEDNINIFFSDPTRLKQVLFNLLSNACKFTRNGTVELNIYREAEDDKEWMCFSISDTGIGIAKEKLRQLFDPFSQADISTTRLYGGTGLGLTISKHFITLMKGGIYIKSELGKGSTFTIKLPCSYEDKTKQISTF